MPNKCIAKNLSIDQIVNGLQAGGLVGVALDDLETAALFSALKHCDDNRTRAAELLGISVRTLQRKLKQQPDD